jgi:hypothetical protein
LLLLREGQVPPAGYTPIGTFSQDIVPIGAWKNKKVTVTIVMYQKN